MAFEPNGENGYLFIKAEDKINMSLSNFDHLECQMYQIQ